MTSRCLLALAIILFTPALHAQNMADHTYTSATIATGSRVYLQRCALCHGPDGGWVEDINLARGKFKSVVTDKDLIEIIHRGAGDGRMPTSAAVCGSRHAAMKRWDKCITTRRCCTSATRRVVAPLRRCTVLGTLPHRSRSIACAGQAGDCCGWNVHARRQMLQKRSATTTTPCQAAECAEA